MRSLPAAALTLLAVLAGAGSAQGASFSSPRTLADWAPGDARLAVAPGAAAWTHAGGLRFWRDRGTLAMFFMLPVMQLALFGFLDQNVRNLPTVVVDQDQTRYSGAG